MTVFGRHGWFPVIVFCSVSAAELLYRASGLMDWTATFFQRPGYLRAYFWLFPVLLIAGLLWLGRWRPARNHAVLWIVAGTLMAQLAGSIAFVLAPFFSSQDRGLFLNDLATLDGLTATLMFTLMGPVIIGLSWFQGAISSVLTYVFDKMVERKARSDSPG